MDRIVLEVAVFLSSTNIEIPKFSFFDSSMIISFSPLKEKDLSFLLLLANIKLDGEVFYIEIFFKNFNYPSPYVDWYTSEGMLDERPIDFSSENLRIRYLNALHN